MTTISADPACCLTETRSKVTCPATDKPASPLSDGDINKIVEQKLRSNNFRVSQWSLDIIGEPNGYLGQYYRLSVTVRVDDKSKSLKFFAKTPPPTSSPQYEFLTRYNTFNKEMLVYSDVIVRIGNGDGPKWSPDFYFGKPNTILVLEDANHEGYVTPDKYVPFDEEHCIWLVKALSTLHSRSLILDEKLRRTGQTIQDLYGHLLEEVAFVASDLVAQKYLSSCTTGACTLVDMVEGWTEKEKTVVKKRIGRWIERLPELLVSSTKYRNLMCHRDIWPNNVMFKEDSTGKPIGCYLVDFQFLRYSPPAMDFVISLYLTTNRATRNRCYDSFVQIYYDTMRQQLDAEGLKVEECFPLAEFRESCKEYRQTALTYAVTNMQVMLLTKSAVEKYFVGSTDELENVMYGDERRDLVISQCREMKAYKPRIIEVIEEIKEHLPDYPPNC